MAFKNPKAIKNNSNKTKPNIKNNVSKPKAKSKSGGGLFGMFKKKKDNGKDLYSKYIPTDSGDDFEDLDDDIPSLEELQKDEQYIEIQRQRNNLLNEENGLSNQSQMVHTTSMENPKETQKENLKENTEETIQHVVGKSLDELDIELISKGTCLFLYSKPSYYGELSAYFHSYNDITCLGTTIKSELIPYYREVSRVVSNMILFVTDKEDIEPVIDLISSLGLEHLSPKYFQVYIIIWKDLNTNLKSRLESIKGISKFVKMLLAPPNNNFEALCKEIITRIVESQPSHEDTEPVIPPQQAQITDPVDGQELNYIHFVDAVDSIRENGQSVSDATIERIIGNIASARNLNEGLDSLNVDNMEKIVGQFKEYINEVKVTGTTNNEDIEQLVQSFLYVSLLQSEHMREITDKVSLNLSNNISNSENEFREIGEILAKYTNKKEETNELLDVRNDIRTKLIEYGERVKSQVNLLNRTTAVIEEKLKGISKDCLDIYNSLSNGDNETTELLDKVNSLIIDYNTQSMTHLETNRESLKETVKTLTDFCNKQELLLELDDKIIDSFRKIIVSADRLVTENTIVNIKAETRLQEHLRIIYTVPGCGAHAVCNVLRSNNSIFVKLLKNNTQDEINDLVKNNNINYSENEYFTLQDFINIPVDELKYDKLKVIYVNADTVSEDEINLLVNLLDYMTPYIDKVYAFIDIVDSNKSYPVEDRFIQLTNKVNTFVTPTILDTHDIKYAVNNTMNRIHSPNNAHIVSKQLIINKATMTANIDAIKKNIKSQLGLNEKVSIIVIPETEDIYANEIASALRQQLRDRI